MLAGIPNVERREVREAIRARGLLCLSGEQRDEEAASQGAEECPSVHHVRVRLAASSRRDGAASGSTLHQSGGRVDGHFPWRCQQVLSVGDQAARICEKTPLLNYR